MSNKNIAQLDYDTQLGIEYLHSINDLSRRDLIVPSLDRDLTDAGRGFVNTAFGDTLDIGRVVRIVEEFRQGKPDFSEVDAFVVQASDVVYTLSSDSKKAEINASEEERSMRPDGTYFLGGIHVLRKATEAGMITVNPPGSPRNQCYIKYN
ncbi:hypothetical protein HOD05_00065 [Candidatus Woesearchaeota archaeon]|jgi:hypothetical protein|nr:hypothetical protein [Candidatus Woesearchaeota archaeon]MBT4150807.1 hypothetical protein [Candidatus Woesearchaeota archaeon]MBT4246912.1 hypothetical protein [Candidatus Woesearchaeota archaeon]MBT4433597.1 hypothetical protein [Candidatus Woesearchaeota archaeon]MBT7332322.1 hypothetical protein [Candidatus Woesearchaeota archaeon]